MDCARVRTLLSPYVDDELDLVHSVELEEHLHACASCSQTWRNLRELQSALGGLRYEAPPELLRQVRRRPQVAPRALLAAAVLLVMFGLGWWLWPRPEVDEVVAAHVRSLMADHLNDVASTSQHTVKPWFEGRLDFAPPVPDPDPSEFPLAGGRLDYLQGHPVAALVYRHRKHVINVFVWPLAGAPQQLETTRRGYTVIAFARGGMQWYAVSDTAPETLRQLVALLRPN